MEEEGEKTTLYNRSFQKKEVVKKLVKNEACAKISTPLEIPGEGGSVMSLTFSQNLFWIMTLDTCATSMMSQRIKSTRKDLDRAW